MPKKAEPKTNTNVIQIVLIGQVALKIMPKTYKLPNYELNMETVAVRRWFSSQYQFFTISDDSLLGQYSSNSK